MTLQQFIIGGICFAAGFGVQAWRDGKKWKDSDNMMLRLLGKVNFVMVGFLAALILMGSTGEEVKAPSGAIENLERMSRAWMKIGFVTGSMGFIAGLLVFKGNRKLAIALLFLSTLMLLSSLASYIMN